VKRLLVTGSEGFIGIELLRSLRKQDFEIATVDIIPGVDKSHVVADIADNFAISKIFNDFKPNVVVHLAAQIDVQRSFQDSTSDLATNGLGTLNILQNAISNGCENFCFIHSGGAVYNSLTPLPLRETSPEMPQSPYGLTKNLAEGYVRVLCERAGIDWSSLALSNCYGPVNRHKKGVVYEFQYAIKENKPPLIYGESNTRDFIFIDDVITAILKAIEKPVNTRVNISSSTETSIGELYSKIARILGTNLSPKILPARHGDITRSCLSNEKAKHILDWEPTIDLDEGLKRALYV
jgi:UDP-glucose 4-epimerase